MAPRLRFFGAERGAETITLAQRRGGGLDVQLARLGQISLAEIEVVGGKEIPCRLADRAGENRRIDEREALLVEEVAGRLDHFVSHARDRHLAAAAQPEEPVLEQERGAGLLARTREIR